MHDINAHNATLENIKKKLVEHTGCDKTRELSVYKIPYKQKTVTVLFYLEGIPPCGYALYILDRKLINFYAASGRRIKVYTMSGGFPEFDNL